MDRYGYINIFTYEKKNLNLYFKKFLVDLCYKQFENFFFLRGRRGGFHIACAYL